MGLSRRSFLVRAAGAAVVVLFPASGRGAAARGEEAAPARSDGWLDARGRATWTPVPYPLPLPGDGGDAASDGERLAFFEVRDALVVPREFRVDPLLLWGERWGPADDPDRIVRVGTNADAIALVPVPGQADEWWLCVNHEAISPRTWLPGMAEEVAAEFPALTTRVVASQDASEPALHLEIDGFDLGASPIQLVRRWPELPGAVQAALERLCTLALDDLGIIAVRIKRAGDGSYHVVREAGDHRRFTGCRVVNADPRIVVRGSGGDPRRDRIALGTMANCSGTVTPWGTMLSCEENFQDLVGECVDAAGSILAPELSEFAADDGGAMDERPVPIDVQGWSLGLAAADPRHADRRLFGWVTEMDPARGTLCKHVALGRFRHENVALVARAGERLVAYQGDDRRGGHLWKFVSRVRVRDPRDPACSALLDDGILHVARLEADGSGTWIPIVPETPLAHPQPERTLDGWLFLPRRPTGGYVRVGAGDRAELSVAQWEASIEWWTGKPFAEITLGDLVRPAPPSEFAHYGAEARRQSALDLILLDAFVMAAAAGGTPLARPEDIEVHPHHGGVYVAMTDQAGSGEGSPDRHVFPDAARQTSRRLGGILRLDEEGSDPCASRFGWALFAASGEVHEGGGGFAHPDNLAFDAAGNLWVVTDIPSEVQNQAVTRTDASAVGERAFAGAFGSGAIFVIPTDGDLAGVPQLFATAPPECELTGLVFSPDGRALFVSVQHPGEAHGPRAVDANGAPASAEREFVIAARDGRLFTQRRRVPLGSSWPSGAPGAVPRSSVVCIRKSES